MEEVKYTEKDFIKGDKDIYYCNYDIVLKLDKDEQLRYANDLRLINKIDSSTNSEDKQIIRETSYDLNKFGMGRFGELSRLKRFISLVDKDLSNGYIHSKRSKIQYDKAKETLRIQNKY